MSLLEKIVDFFGVHKHNYTEVHLGAVPADKRFGSISWKQYECSGCTKTLCSYDGRMPEHKTYERKEDIIRNRYEIK